MRSSIKYYVVSDGSLVASFTKQDRLGHPITKTEATKLLQRRCKCRSTEALKMLSDLVEVAANK